MENLSTEGSTHNTDDSIRTEQGLDRPRDQAGNGLLIEPRRAEDFGLRWQRVQTEFVDDPRAAVSEADRLVQDVMSAITDQLSEGRRRLEQTWDRSGDDDTEAMRQAMQAYRSFFQSLLSTTSGA